MINASRRPGSRGALRNAILGASLFAALLTLTKAHAQTSPEAETPLQRQLDRVDFAVSGAGQFSTSTTGLSKINQNLTLVPSNTFGALVTIRYIKSPFVGFEGNFGYARYTENVTASNTATSLPNASPLAFGIQTNADEYTLGYIAHTRGQYFGLYPFAAVGAGSIAFKPTARGGLSYSEQARAAYYYTIGVDSPVVSKYFGFRAQFRQLIYLAPDYETNYLTNLKRSIASEPTLGFYIKF